MKIFIYYLHRGDNIPFYIGKTNSLVDRLRDHNYKRGKCFIEILEETTEEEWYFLEKYYIKYFTEKGYILENLNGGGGGSIIGKPKHTIEYKLLLKEKTPLKNLSPQSREKIYSKERNLKISKSLQNRIFSNEHKNKLSKIKKGKLSNSSRKIIQYSLIGEFIKEWDSITLAKKYIGKGDIQGCVLGKTKTAGGYKWEYKK